MFGLGVWEFGVLAIIAIVVIGPKSLPGVVRFIGTGIREFRGATDALKASVDPRVPSPPRREPPAPVPVESESPPPVTVESESPPPVTVESESPVPQRPKPDPAAAQPESPPPSEPTQASSPNAQTRD